MRVYHCIIESSLPYDDACIEWQEYATEAARDRVEARMVGRMESIAPRSQWTFNDDNSGEITVDDRTFTAYVYHITVTE